MEHAWRAWTGDEPVVFHNINLLISWATISLVGTVYIITC